MTSIEKRFMKRKKYWLLILAVLLAIALSSGMIFQLLKDKQQAWIRPSKNTLIEGIREQAERGDIFAQYILGFRYHEGQGVPQDYNQAVLWYSKAAEQGDIAAQFCLGSMYYSGQGVPQDYKQAILWYTKAAEQGEARPQFYLALMYYNGHGVPQDYKQAVLWFTKAAEQGEAYAQFYLALMYYNAQGVPQDYKQAILWYTKAAEQGVADAQYNLGTMYSNGLGVPQDYKQAVTWYTKAAEQGNAPAQYNLASMYDNGQGVPQNHKQAVLWYTKAAEQGEASAQFALGVRYYYGQGVIEDYVEAYKWLLLAGMNGEDVTELKNMVSSKMMPPQVMEAQNRAKEFVQRKQAQAGDEKASTTASDSIKAFGTGFFVSSSGYILTAFHVVDGAKKISIITSSGTYQASVVFSDKPGDICVLKIQGGGFPWLEVISSAQVTVAEQVWTVGYPNVVLQGAEPKYTEGTISSLTGFNDNIRYFQVSVPIQPGNSGGPLLDRSGRVVGVLVSKLNDLTVLGLTGSLPQNVNYAIKSAFALPILDSIPGLQNRQNSPPRKSLERSKLIDQAMRATALIVCY